VEVLQGLYSWYCSIESGGRVMGFLHSEVCDKHLREGYNQAYYGIFCTTCDENYRIKNPDFVDENEEEMEF